MLQHIVLAGAIDLDAVAAKDLHEPDLQLRPNLKSIFYRFNGAVCERPVRGGNGIRVRNQKLYPRILRISPKVSLTT